MEYGFRELRLDILDLLENEYLGTTLNIFTSIVVTNIIVLGPLLTLQESVLTLCT